MKIRLAEKILGITGEFNNWDSNYQPYSVSQQRKAIKALKFPPHIRKLLNDGVYGKVPVEYRKYNPVQIAQIMLGSNENIKSMKNYRRFMRKILKGGSNGSSH